jgi:hypothetical protein
MLSQDERSRIEKRMAKALRRIKRLGLIEPSKLTPQESHALTLASMQRVRLGNILVWNS